MGVQDLVIVVEEELAMKLVRAGFGEDLDPAKPELVIFCRERVLIDANFPDRRLGR